VIWEGFDRQVLQGKLGVFSCGGIRSTFALKPGGLLLSVLIQKVSKEIKNQQSFSAKSQRVARVLVLAFPRRHASREKILWVDVHEPRGLVRGFVGGKPSAGPLRDSTVENRALFVASFLL